jgi:hypothetical protein
MSLGHSLHLARRFFGSLSTAPPSVEDRAWVSTMLDPRVDALWARMTPPDQRHSVAVARQVAAEGVSREAVAAALMHDVGKVDSKLGTFGRVAATLVAGALGDVRVASWSPRRGPMGSVGRYRNHAALGAELLSEAGAPVLACDWAGQHHLSPDSCSLDPKLAGLLRAADND